MINNYEQITWKYLKANKKRTILTIVGVVLSIALICSIGFFFEGIQANEKDYCIKTYGAAHLNFTKPNEDLVAKVVNNPKVSRSGLVEYFDVEKYDDKVSVKNIIGTRKALELLPYSIKEGRFPESDKEVALEKWFLRYIDKNAVIGSIIKILNKSYTLTGILEDSISDQTTGMGMVLTKADKVDTNKAELLVEISSKTNIRSTVKELEKLAPSNELKENRELLTIERAGDGQTDNTITMILDIIIGIVLVVTVAVIYNAFQISVVERIKQFGLLRAVGTTPKQIRKIVIREATIIGIIGIPIGLILGVFTILGISLTFRIIGGNDLLFIKLTINPFVMVFSAAVGIISIYMSALLPAFFAGKISPLAAINGNINIRKEKIKRNKSFILGKLFGFEGEMTSKNIKRNKKRYRITVFSIIISVTLFIVFKSFTDMVLYVDGRSNENSKTNFSIYSEGNNESNKGISEDIVTNISSLSSIAKVYKTYSQYTYEAIMDKGNETKAMKDMGNIYNELEFNGKQSASLESRISIYDKQALEASKSYLTQGSVDFDNLTKENGVIVINKNRVNNPKTNKNYQGPIGNFKIGDEIIIKTEEKTIKVKVVGVFEGPPFTNETLANGINLVTNQVVAKNISGNKPMLVNGIDLVMKTGIQESVAASQLENALVQEPTLRLVNNMDLKRTNNSANLMLQILLYGFVVVVALIGSVNIMNTLTTNIILRRRELATLKAVGLTQKGLKKMIILEGSLYGAFGALYGSIIGTGLSYLVYKSLVPIREFDWQIPWMAMIIATFFALLIGYISVLSPLARIKKDNLIDTVREDY